MNLAKKTFLILMLVGCGLLSAGPMQQGHPLTGTWAGDWGPAGGPRTHLTFVLGWDGERVSGTINPGPDAIDVKNIVVNVTNWSFRFDAETKDKSGAAVRISAEGKIENLGSLHRTLVGTWNQGAVSGDLMMKRD